MLKLTQVCKKWTNPDSNRRPPADDQKMLSGRDNQLHHMPYERLVEPAEYNGLRRALYLVGEKLTDCCYAVMKFREHSNPIKYLVPISQRWQIGPNTSIAIYVDISLVMTVIFIFNLRS